MTKFNFSHKNILVLGAARSGIAAAKALKQAGANVRVCETKDDDKTEAAVDELERYGITAEIGEHSPGQLAGADLVMPSPGISPFTPILAAAVAKGLPIFSEIEVAWQLSKNPIIGVTGSNGKTTTTTLIGEILNAAGKKAIVAGNIGYPLTEAVSRAVPGDYLVAELSSFQLEFTSCFRPHIAVVLNITPDHIDWHGDLNSYVIAKHKIFANQHLDDWAVINADDPAAAPDYVEAKKLFFSRLRPVAGSYCLNGEIIAGIEDGQFLGRTAEIGIKGEHNLENCLAAIAAASALGIDGRTAMDVIHRFTGVEHRLELVAEHQGVKYYNDSKATNPEAVINGVKAFEQPVILLAGGRNKGNSFAELADGIRGRVKAAILFGEASGEISSAFEAREIGVNIVKSLEEAVRLADTMAEMGDVVLLSPACASYDMFLNFEERGRVFKEIVKSGLKVEG